MLVGKPPAELHDPTRLGEPHLAAEGTHEFSRAPAFQTVDVRVVVQPPDRRHDRPKTADLALEFADVPQGLGRDVRLVGVQARLRCSACTRGSAPGSTWRPPTAEGLENRWRHIAPVGLVPGLVLSGRGGRSLTTSRRRADRKPPRWAASWACTRSGRRPPAPARAGRLRHGSRPSPYPASMEWADRVIGGDVARDPRVQAAARAGCPNIASLLVADARQVGGGRVGPRGARAGAGRLQPEGRGEHGENQRHGGAAPNQAGGSAAVWTSSHPPGAGSAAAAPRETVKARSPDRRTRRGGPTPVRLAAARPPPGRPDAAGAGRRAARAVEGYAR